MLLNSRLDDRFNGSCGWFLFDNRCRSSNSLFTFVVNPGDCLTNRDNGAFCGTDIRNDA
ncbi:hypothetical protein D3C81_2169500 [compost metagenome]